MKTIIEIIGIACFAWLFAEGANIPIWIKWIIAKKEEVIETRWFNGEETVKTVMKREFGWAEKRLKPLDCSLCLSFWLSLIYFSITLQSYQAIFYAAICSVIATLISKFTRV